MLSYEFAVWLKKFYPTRRYRYNMKLREDLWIKLKVDIMNQLQHISSSYKESEKFAIQIGNVYIYPK